MCKAQLLKNYANVKLLYKEEFVIEMTKEYF